MRYKPVHAWYVFSVSKNIRVFRCVLWLTTHPTAKVGSYPCVAVIFAVHTNIQSRKLYPRSPKDTCSHAVRVNFPSHLAAGS